MSESELYFSSSSTATATATYEATKARLSIANQPDKIHWDGSSAFRDCPYRLLHQNQRGLIGMFRVRLLEAKDLKRSYWSALALGPVKHLGWSKAHGAASSYCSFSLAFQDGNTTRTLSGKEDLDKKPAAKASSSSVGRQKSAFTSPVVPNDNCPVWENCQFECPLVKGAMPSDGMQVILSVRVEEDATALENIMPGVPSGGSDARLLGVGRLDLTELCLGETLSGQPLPGVRDAWIPISLVGQQQEELSDQVEQALLYNKKDPLAPPSTTKENLPKPPVVTGMVRVLVSYQPHGLEPQAHDIIALEAFARRNPSISSCQPILPPLLPLVVLERRGPYLLCEYTLSDGRKACVRIHRNSVFVIERQNIMDAAHNLALLPIDVIASTPLGQATCRALGPAVSAGKEILMPALLSFKLVWLAARTTTLAGLSGVSALGSTLWQEGSSSLTASHRDNHPHLLHSNNSSSSSNRRFYEEQHRQDSRTATAQFVSL